MSDQTLVTYEFIEAKDKEIECLTALWQTVHASNYKLRDRVDKLERVLAALREAKIEFIGTRADELNAAIAACNKDKGDE